MTPRTWVPVGLFVAGLAVIAWSVIEGESEVSLVLIFPVFSGSSALFLAGIGLILLSFVLGFVMLWSGQAELANSMRGADIAAPAQETKTEYGGVVLLGPVPIAFGSSHRIATAMLVVGIVVAILIVVAYLLLL